VASARREPRPRCDPKARPARRDSSGSCTKQHSINVAKPERSHPRLPGACDLRCSVDAGQHRSQPPLPEQPVERASKLRLIASGYKAAPSLQHSIDLCTCIHAERMRMGQTDRAVRDTSVDGCD
jgi:hypothetical protein